MGTWLCIMCYICIAYAIVFSSHRFSAFFLIHMNRFSDSAGRTTAEAHQPCVLATQVILCCGAAIKAASLSTSMLSRYHQSQSVFIFSSKVNAVWLVPSHLKTNAFLPCYIIFIPLIRLHCSMHNGGTGSRPANW